MMKFYFCVQKSVLGTSTQLLFWSKIGILIIFHAVHPVAVPGCCAQLPSMMVEGKVANLLCPGLIVSPLVHCYATSYSLLTCI